ncbi:MAG: hypothetical protein ACI8S6_001950 [Myxococcota bacterium]|jgi:hypothetical protein
MSEAKAALMKIPSGHSRLAISVKNAASDSGSVRKCETRIAVAAAKGSPGVRVSRVPQWKVQRRLHGASLS